MTSTDKLQNGRVYYISIDYVMVIYRDLRLKECMFAYRVTINQTNQETTFFLLFGRNAVLPGDLIFNVKPIKIESDDPAEYKSDPLRRLR